MSLPQRKGSFAGHIQSALGGDGSTYAQHMKDARFTIPTSLLRSKVVDLIDIPRVVLAASEAW